MKRRLENALLVLAWVLLVAALMYYPTVLV
jgi:hypothetical protein